MPFLRISLRQGTSPPFRKAIADGIHRAMVEVPAVSAEHSGEGMLYHSDDLGAIAQTPVFVQIAPQAATKASLL